MKKRLDFHIGETRRATYFYTLKSCGFYQHQLILVVMDNVHHHSDQPGSSMSATMSTNSYETNSDCDTKTGGEGICHQSQQPILLTRMWRNCILFVNGMMKFWPIRNYGCSKLVALETNPICWVGYFLIKPGQLLHFIIFVWTIRAKCAQIRKEVISKSERRILMQSQYYDVTIWQQREGRSVICLDDCRGAIHGGCWIGIHHHIGLMLGGKI